MNIMSKLKNKQKALIVAGSLLFGLGLALTSTASIAANAEYERHRDNNKHNTNNQHGNKHYKQEIEHQYQGRPNYHNYTEHQHHTAKWHRRHQHKHMKHYYKNHYHQKHYHGHPHYVLSNDHYYHHPDHFDFEIGVHTDNIDLIMRD
jgi:hypothetical protein